MDQARLRRLQLTQRRLGGVARGASDARAPYGQRAHYRGAGRCTAGNATVEFISTNTILYLNWLRFAKSNPHFDASLTIRCY
jgi:hypothetical protein